MRILKTVLAPFGAQSRANTPLLSSSSWWESDTNGAWCDRAGKKLGFHVMTGVSGSDSSYFFVALCRRSLLSPLRARQDGARGRQHL